MHARWLPPTEWAVTRLLALFALLSSSACKVERPAQAAPLPAAAANTESLPFTSVAVLPIRAKGQADTSVLEVLDDLLLSSLQNTAGETLRVVGKSDIDAMLGFEKAKDAVGCDEVSCAAEIAGALGVESIIAATAGTLGSRYILTLVWIDQTQVRAWRRHSEPLGTSPRTFDTGVNRAVAALLGLKSETPPPAEVEDPAPTPGHPLADLTFNKIKDERTGLCITLANRANPGEPVRVFPCPEAQTRFVFMLAGPLVQLRDRHTGKCVDVRAKALPGDKALVADCALAGASWEVVHATQEGQVVSLLRDLRTGWCLEVANDARAGDVVKVWECSATDTLFQFF